MVHVQKHGNAMKENTLWMSNFTFSVNSSPPWRPSSSSGWWFQARSRLNIVWTVEQDRARGDVLDLMRWSLFMWYDEFDMIKRSSVIITFWSTRTGAPRATFPTRHKLFSHCTCADTHIENIILAKSSQNKIIL